MIIVGIDPSLTHTGWVIMEDGLVLGSGVIKSKSQGDTYLAEVERIVKIVNMIFMKITFYCNDKERKPDLVVIEGLAFMARNSTALVQLAGLSYQIRIQLAHLEIPFVIIAPTSLKKFITGSGRGDKNLMLMNVYKNYGFEASDDNECDAYSLAVVGSALLGKPIKSLIKPQEEVINLLKKQL